MKKATLFIIIFGITILNSISIYDIQHTTDPGPDGTYPSPYNGQIVTTGGIVNAVDFNSGRFFITSGMGEWNGIYVYNYDQNVAVGDSVIIEAEVYEYWGFTELSNLVSCDIISSGNPIPATLVNTISNTINEARESTKAAIGYYDLTITQTYDEWGQWKIADTTGECTISTGFMNMEELDIPIIEGYPLSGVSGFVTYFWEEFQLNPVNLSSIHSDPDDHIISIQDQLVFSPEEFEIPIYHTVFNDGQVQSYQFEIAFNDQVLEYSGYEDIGTLSANGTIVDEQLGNGNIAISYNGNFSFENMETLLKLNFVGIESGDGELEFVDFAIDALPVDYFSVEEITLQLETMPIGDTLTVIQRPIQNVPQITIPNEEFTIECLADASTSNWSAELVHQNKVISLDITNTNYNTAVDRWYLTAICSQPEIYELYDMVVDADGVIADTTRNAVHLIPEIKSDYSFIHITDTHLPTHIFYPDPISLTDSTEIEDLREVIRDINLIKPEFVLLTGDLLNEGELEDFENRRVYTKAQKILEELEVPLYLTSGNHDLGGWDSTPPSQGTARRDWWRFFGWSWLLDPPALDPYYTQNYSFDYGPIHYIGMEAYLNYDSYLYNIYDAESFTDLQMQWLENDLSNASSSESHVIFYHNDFSNQIDLNSMGIEMALYGHIHSNSGSITSPPYNLSTESTCDGNRAYRVININDDQLEPTNAVYAGYSGGELTATFTPENSGAADSIFCYVENSHNLDFNDAQLKFIMPNNAEEYIVFNGILTQVDESGDFAVCYISVDIPANGNVSVSVVADLDASAQNPLTPQDLQLTNYPNPFNPTTTISFSLAESSSLITLGIYNLKGQKVKDLSGTLSRIEGRREMQHSVVWNGTDDKGVSVSSGIYFVRLNCGNKEAQQKIMLLK